MSWILAFIYCGGLWLVFAKLKLIRLSLPIAILAGSVGPALIILLLLFAQYLHPYTSVARVYQEVVPIVPQLRQAGRVSTISVRPNTPVKKGDPLFSVDPVPYENSVNRLTAALEEARQSEQVAEASVVLARASQSRAEADLKLATDNRDRVNRMFEKDAVSEQEKDVADNQYAEADAAFSQSKAALTQATLSVATARTKIDQVATQLDDAKYDLQQTIVYAPGDGYVTNLHLGEGMLVGGPGGGAVMSFVMDKTVESRGVIVAAFDQKNFLRITEGQFAEVALFGYPGQIFTGRVLNVIDISGAGQLTASGILPSDLGGSEPAMFAARIKLDDAAELRLPAGSQAQVAVYTEDIQIAGIPVMFLIRAQSWIRYVM